LDLADRLLVFLDSLGLIQDDLFELVHVEKVEGYHEEEHNGPSHAMTVVTMVLVVAVVTVMLGLFSTVVSHSHGLILLLGLVALEDGRREFSSIIERVALGSHSSRFAPSAAAGRVAGVLGRDR
jgi:hypothetical protein